MQDKFNKEYKRVAQGFENILVLHNVVLNHIS